MQPVIVISSAHWVKPDTPAAAPYLLSQRWAVRCALPAWRKTVNRPGTFDVKWLWIRPIHELIIGSTSGKSEDRHNNLLIVCFVFLNHRNRLWNSTLQQQFFPFPPKWWDSWFWWLVFNSSKKCKNRKRNRWFNLRKNSSISNLLLIDTHDSLRILDGIL